MGQVNRPDVGRAVETIQSGFGLLFSLDLSREALVIPQIDVLLGLLAQFLLLLIFSELFENIQHAHCVERSVVQLPTSQWADGPRTFLVVFAEVFFVDQLHYCGKSSGLLAVHKVLLYVDNVVELLWKSG